MQLPENDFLIEELICNDSFQQYCLGTSLENHVFWENWINNLPERAVDIENAKKIVNILTVKQGSRLQQVKDLKNAFKQKEVLNLLLSSGNHEKTLYQKNNNFYKYMSLTAAAVIILVSLYFIQQAYLPSKDNLSVNTLAETLFSSGSASRKTVVLTDGTVITLNKNSEIRLSRNFTPVQREIWLKGEAFFEVKHDAAHPFTVHTSMNDIKVLGTSFNVKAYPQSAIIETSLIRGRVQVASKKYPGYTVILKPDQKLSYRNIPADKNTALEKIFLVSSMDHQQENHPYEEIQWVRNRMVIDNEPLAEIAGKLQNWYGIEVYIADQEVKDYRYSGTFENESIVKMLEALQIAYPFKFKAAQNRITISK
ncbi:ferric-dicitrate binding protein FerR (iron transport regulator) [Pedobacter cryoconitis]|uniref:FecR family protein n=1 Tax=Pedobacter cryoconitis TaxID=188932 RepID=UPI0016086EB8|nr:FecR domain-containing protein [Pedobacter cryoconitis]MBB6270225.1 ferric-dicitrate binding protein FerR (iron transport regulator) [Pedobacter cryoconitis]